MFTIQDYIDSLKTDKETLVANLTTKGITCSSSETFTTLVPKVLDIVTGITPTGNINITNTNLTDVTNYATAQVVDSNLISGNIKKDVNILGVTGTYEGVNLNDYFENTLSSNTANNLLSSLLTQIVKNLPPITIANTVTSLQNAFMGYRGINVPILTGTTNVTNTNSMFNNANYITSVSLFDTSSVNNMSGMFINCYALTTIPQFNTSSVTNFQNFLSTNANASLSSIPLLDFSSATNISGLLDASGYEQRDSLTTIGGFKDLGEAYSTSQSANYSNYKLDLSYCHNLTHDSLMNIINNLYDIATAGCNIQTIKLSTPSLALLSSAEIQIATNKGWNITT